MLGDVPRDASPAFIGRQAEISRLDAAWEHAVGGEPQLVLIGGDAGIGKTRLMREYLAQPAHGRVVALGGCVPVAGGSLPYTPFIELLRTLASPGDAGYDPQVVLEALAPASRAELGRLVPALRSADSAAPAPTQLEGDESLARARLFEAVLSYLLGIAAQAPLLLVIEDLHWADGSSRDLLSYLVRNLRTERILVLATYRSDELHRRHPLRPWAAELGRLDHVERLALRPLADADLRADVAEVLGSDAEPSLVDRIVERSEGNPLFAIELVASARGGTDARELPETVRDGFIDRLERLEPDARLVSRHAAVFMRPVSERLLGDSTELPPDRLAAGIHQALDAQVLTTLRHETGQRFETRHALLGEAIVDDLLPGERTALHRRIADLLEAGVDDDNDPARIAGEIAYHRWAAHDTELAVAASVRATVAATDARAPAEADAHWTRALEAWPAEGEVEGFDQPAALLRAGEVAGLLGDLSRAVDLATQALERIDPRADPLRAARAHRALTWLLAPADREASALHIAQAARLIPVAEAPAEAAGIMAQRAFHLNVRLSLGRAEHVARRALDLARRYEAPDTEAQALVALGFCLYERSEHTSAIEVLERAFALAEQRGEARLGVFGLLVTVADTLCVTLNDVGHWQEALAYADRLATRFGGLGLGRYSGPWLMDYRTWSLLSLGRWEEAEMFLATLAVDPVVADGSTFGAWLAGTRAVVRARQGRVEDAARLLTAAATDEDTKWVGNLIRVASGYVHAQAEVALAQGRWTELRLVAARAFAYVPAKVRDMCPELRPFALLGLQAEAELAFEARIRRDAEAEAEAIRIGQKLAGWARNLGRRVTEAGEPLAATTLADAACAEALLTRVEHRPDPDAWRTALERCEGVGNPYDIARVRHWLAEAILDGGGSRAAAAAELTPALATATELGAAGLERQIRDVARRARLELGSADGEAEAEATVAATLAARDADDRPATTSPAALVEPLTPREREVLGYVASGWTNRRIGEALFISEKTVGVHVSNLMGKLGAANRAEAALIGDRLGLVGSTAQG
jgi:DNA-binding CsgD family transcriptional regulator/tetratricopeptide (TPR) repeat protein